MKVRGLARSFGTVLLAASIVMTGMYQGAPLKVNAQEKEAQIISDDDWSMLSEKLKSYGGEWDSPEYEGAINDIMPQTALQGNGDTGVVSYGNAMEKTYLISKGDFRNGGDLVTSAPYDANDRSIRQIALGGVTIKRNTDENPSLTMNPEVTVEASSMHDDFAPERAVNGQISSGEEGWVSKQGGGSQWFKIDLGTEKVFQKYVMYHIGMARTDLRHFNTKAYTVSVSKDDVQYEDVDVVTENQNDYTQKIFDQPIRARYIKITFQEAQQTEEIGAQRARIAEFELFESPEAESIFMPGETGDFNESQDITGGDVTTKMTIGGAPLEMRNWLSATENTMITSISSNGENQVALDVKAWVKEDGSANFPVKSGALDHGVWASRSTYNAAKDNPESWTSEAVILTKLLGEKEFTAKKSTDGSASLSFTLEPGETVNLVTTIGGGGQTYDAQGNLQGEEPLEQAQALSEKYGSEQDLMDLREEHDRWWKDYWTKSYIDIGDEEYHRYYYGSLYYMGCAAREDKTAPGLYGIWVTTDKAKWNNDYHLNYNYMAPFYGMYSSNRYESAYALTQPILDYMPKAEEAAKNNLSDIKKDYVDSRPELADGIDDAVLYPVGLAAWGQASWKADSPEKYLNQTLNAPFAASIFISYYNYTKDEEFLTERAWPFLEKVANFYAGWCEKEEKSDGTYQYNLYDGPHEGFFYKNSGVTIGVVLNLYEFLIDNFHVLEEKAGASEEQLAMWTDMYEHMAPVPVRMYENGSFKKEVFALGEEGMIIRPESASVELEFIHPGERLSFDSDPELLEIARNTVEAKEAANSGVWSNINNTPKIFTHAIRAGFDPAYIMEKFRESNLSRMLENFTISDGNHGIEKAGGIEFINNMLLQSSDGILKVFPNWTGADASFYQLREKGAFLVSSRLEQGEVQYIDIVSEAGGELTIVNPWEKEASVLDSEGHAVEMTLGTTQNTGEETITFQTVKGGRYRLTGEYEEKITVNTKIPVYRIGQPFHMPDTINISVAGETFDTEVIWDTDEIQAVTQAESVGTYTVTGTLPELGRTIQVEVAASLANVVYFVDSGASDFTETGRLLVSTNAETIRNAVPDQSYHEETGWGFTNPEEDLEVNGSGDTYTTIRNFKSGRNGKTLTYQFALEKGTYRVIAGFYDPWAQYAGDNRHARVFLKDETGRELAREQDHPITGSKTTVQFAGIAVEEDGDVSLNVEPLNSGNDNCDMMISFILIQKEEDAKQYAVSIDGNIKNGSITASAAYARAGETVTLTAEPDDGYWLLKNDLSVTVKETGENVELTKASGDTYTFRMPAGNVTVTAQFRSDLTVEEALAMAKEALEEAMTAQKEAIEAKEAVIAMQEQAKVDLETAKDLRAEAEQMQADAKNLQEQAGASSETAKQAMEEAVKKAGEAQKAQEKALESQKAAETARTEAERLGEQAEAAVKEAERLAGLAATKVSEAEEAAKQAESERIAAEEARKQAEAQSLEAAQIRKKMEEERAAILEITRKSEEARKAAQQAKEELEKLKAQLGQKQEEQKTTVKKVSLKAVKSQKKKELKVTWKKMRGISGYQVQYSTNAKFKNAKTKKLKASKTSLKLKNLKSKKTYYVRVRAYQKTDSGTVYGTYSKAKKGKVK